ncbi:MvdC/MvdD family ATP grasp protein [Streptomyces sp. NPDC056987]|uniref:MvdC/MvdD family ATP grasp protein n=1 Tax=Streptomyces sp. NPDC056987 TaxID=3345988 RepID=UPI00363121CA
MPCSSRPVCVLTTSDNLTADRVILELHGLGTLIVRLDLADFPHRASLDATVVDGRWTGTLRAHRRTLDLAELGAIWWWHPGRATISTSPTLPSAEAGWLSDEANAGLIGVLGALDCLHLNHPLATRVGQSKPNVLAMAAGCGLEVPQTWIGNSPTGALGFVSGPAGQGTVCKSLVSPTIEYDDGSAAYFWTRPVAPEDVNSSLTATAHQFQHAVTKRFEVRLVVVGQRMFPVRIDTHSPAARADFRADYDACTYSHIPLPDPVRQGITALMAHYRLTYASIDLLVDEDDRWWFIDLNPAGQHDWLQQALPDLRISRAIAETLSQPAHTRLTPAQPADALKVSA